MCMLQGAVNNAGGKGRITIGYKIDKIDSSVPRRGSGKLHAAVRQKKIWSAENNKNAVPMYFYWGLE